MHCHNDLGLAVANSLAAVRNGARQVECTINGLGERAGNASLEEVVMAVRVRKDLFDCETRLDTTQIVNCSRLVSGITGFAVQPNKAIVGANAFAHESGIHQDGMLKERSTYEIMRPEDVGFARTDLVMGKHSGRAALNDRVRALGFQLTGEQLQKLFEDFKVLADKKKEVYDGDIVALIDHQLLDVQSGQWQLVAFEAESGTGRTPRAKLTLRREEQDFTEELSTGDGPIDAAFFVVEKITGVKLSCRAFEARSASIGRDAQAEVTLEVEHQGAVYRGRGVSTDTVEATVRAILNAVNRITVTHP